LDNDPGATRSGDQDRDLQDAALLDPVGAGHVTVAVACKEPCEHGASICLA
jgi:hypothetical protein